MLVGPDGKLHSTFKSKQKSRYPIAAMLQEIIKVDSKEAAQRHVLAHLRLVEARLTKLKSGEMSPIIAISTKSGKNRALGLLPVTSQGATREVPLAFMVLAEFDASGTLDLESSEAKFLFKQYELSSVEELIKKEVAKASTKNATVAARKPPKSPPPISFNQVCRCQAFTHLGKPAIQLTETSWVEEMKTQIVAVTKTRTETRTRAEIRNGKQVEVQYSVDVPYTENVEQTYTVLYPILNNLALSATDLMVWTKAGRRLSQGEIQQRFAKPATVFILSHTQASSIESGGKIAIDPHYAREMAGDALIIHWPRSAAPLQGVKRGSLASDPPQMPAAISFDQLVLCKTRTVNGKLKVGFVLSEFLAEQKTREYRVKKLVPIQKTRTAVVDGRTVEQTYTVTSPAYETKTQQYTVYAPRSFDGQASPDEVSAWTPMGQRLTQTEMQKRLKQLTSVFVLNNQMASQQKQGRDFPLDPYYRKLLKPNTLILDIGSKASSKASGKTSAASPAVPPTPVAAMREPLRLWTMQSGPTLVGSFLRVEGPLLILLLPNGAERTIQLLQLVSADQAFVRKRRRMKTPPKDTLANHLTFNRGEIGKIPLGGHPPIPPTLFRGINLSSIEGEYESVRATPDQAPRNGYHSGTLTLEKKNGRASFVWKNTTGVSWRLFPQLKQARLRCEPSAPYYDTGDTAFLLVPTQNAAGNYQPTVAGFYFQGGFYKRK